MVNYLGMNMQQQNGVIERFNVLLDSVRPDVIIELGTGYGCLATMLALYSKINSCFFITYDNAVLDKRTHDTILALGGNISSDDIFSKQTIDTIAGMISQKNRKVLLLCDNGNKIAEVNTFLPFMKEGDVIMAHDYYHSRELFNENFAGVGACEIEYKDIEEGCRVCSVRVVHEDLLADMLWFAGLVSPRKEYLHSKTVGVSAIGKARLDRLYDTARKANNAEGCFAECGVFRGGSAYWLLRATDKHIHLFDSFAGLPELTTDDMPLGDIPVGAGVGGFGADIEAVDNFLSPFAGRYTLHKGWLEDTLPLVDDTKYSLVHLDLDLYESYKTALPYFVPKISPGGYLVCDDYGFDRLPGVQKAVDEYLAGVDFVSKENEIGQLVVRF